VSFRWIIVILFVYLGIQVSFAQSPYFREITDREGLPSLVVYDIYQSQKGYIWLGTEAGLCRYDGTKFETYAIKNVQGKSFTNIREDSQGTIYCMNFLSQLFKIKNKEAIPVALPKSVAKHGFRTYLIDQNDNFWLCADKLYFKAGKESWQVVNLPTTHGAKSIWQDKQQNIWVLSYNGEIHRVNLKLEKIQTIKPPEDLIAFQIQSKNLRVLSKEGNRFYSYDFDTNRWTRIWQDIGNKTIEQIRGFQEDNQGNVWIFTSKGVMHYQTQSKQIKIVIKDVFISHLIQDREGNYWFSSLGQGLFVLSSLEIIHFNRDNSKLNFEQIDCLEADHLGNIYLGTSGEHLFYLDTKCTHLNASYQLSEGGVECLLFDKKRQQLYVENNLLSVFDTKTKRLIKELSIGNTPKDLALFQDKYLISVAGDASFIHAIKPETPIPHYSNENPYLNPNTFVLRRQRGRAVCTEDNYERFWIAYSDGLYYYEAGKARELRAVNNQPIIAISLRVDREGIVWAGTIQQGVFAIKNKQVIKHLHTNNGLISNFCKVVSDNGFLYLGTDQGLQVHHIKTGQNRIFNQQDGLPSNVINDLIVQKDKIYLATNRGLSILNKDFSTTNHQPPLIYFTGFDIWDEAQKLQKAYQLDYHENNLMLHFTGLAFRSGGSFRYKYRMKRLDKKWTHVESSHNFARYSALPSGQYQFEVKAINEDGVESNKTATVYIEIAYPVWEKWWFITLMVLLALGLIMVVFRNQAKAMRRKNQMERALGKATLESLKLQMNPHFLFNAMSAIQRYMIRNDAPKASNYLAQFSKLMRAVLENARSEYISLAQEIEMLENYLALQKLQHRGSFHYTITVDEALDPEEVTIPPMFSQPFIENAIEHGLTDQEQEGLINISFDLDNDFIVLKITDNGIGLEKSRERKQTQVKNHQSLATKITEERIGLYKKSLKKNIAFEVTSSGQGTQVIFHLPYQNL